MVLSLNNKRKQLEEEKDKEEKDKLQEVYEKGFREGYKKAMNKVTGIVGCYLEDSQNTDIPISKI